MNENLNLEEILKDCPKGTKLYSTLYGEVEFNRINKGQKYPIIYINSEGDELIATTQGLLIARFDGECTLFPSKEQRDWSKFKLKKPKFDPKTLKPFDKILVRDSDEFLWRCGFYSHTIENGQCTYKYVTLMEHGYKCCIPYNDDTKHLIDTKDEAPEFYRYWEE